jgi:hypothetical protein
MIVQRVNNAGAQGTRWCASSSAHQQKDQTFEISEKREEGTSPEWLIFYGGKAAQFYSVAHTAVRKRAPVRSAARPLLKGPTLASSPADSTSTGTAFELPIPSQTFLTDVP